MKKVFKIIYDEAPKEYCDAFQKKVSEWLETRKGKFDQSRADCVSETEDRPSVDISTRVYLAISKPEARYLEQRVNRYVAKVFGADVLDKVRVDINCSKTDEIHVKVTFKELLDLDGSRPCIDIIFDRKSPKSFFKKGRNIKVFKVTTLELSGMLYVHYKLDMYGIFNSF